MKKFFMFMCSIALFMGCGGSGSSGEGGEGGYSLDVAVIADTNLYTVEVCFDRDDDMQCNNNDVYAESMDNGSYSLRGAKNDETVGLLAELTPIQPGITNLQSTGRKYILEAPAGQSVISPLTAIVKRKMEANPLISLEAAQDEVKSALGINPEINLLDPADASTVSSVNDKVFDVLSLMFDTLKGLGIDFSKESTLFIYTGIDANLINIGKTSAGDIVNGFLGGKSKDELEQEINGVINNPPVVMTMKDYFNTNPTNDFLTLLYDGYGDYSLIRLAYTTTSMRQGSMDINDLIAGTKPAFDEEKPAKIENTSLVVSINSGVTETISSVIITPLKNQTVKANPSFQSYAISGFDDDAVMYSYDVEHRFAPENVDINCLRDNIGASYYCGESNYAYDAEKTGNVIKGGAGEYVGTLMLKDNNKCEWSYPADNSDAYVFETPVPFTLTGNYTQTGSGSDMTIRCDTTDGGTFVYMSTSADEASGVFAEYRIIAEKFTYGVFNDSAMKTIIKYLDKITP